MNNVAVTMMNKMVRDRYYKPHKPKKSTSITKSTGYFKTTLKNDNGRKENDK